MILQYCLKHCTCDHTVRRINFHFRLIIENNFLLMVNWNGGTSEVPARDNGMFEDRQNILK